jgi:diphthine-ammonia ligase
LLVCLLDSDYLSKLHSLAMKYRFHVDGEGGEYETLVIAGPHMIGALELDYKIHWDGVRGHLIFG